MALPHFKKQTNTVTSIAYETPTWLWDKLNKIYNFYTDPCTFSTNPLKTPLFFTEEDNGLDYTKWKGNTYINPPYFREDLEAWTDQAALYSLLNQERTIVMLVPVKTEQFWFQNLLGRIMLNIKFYFIKGRLRFAGTHHSATFSSMLVIFNDKVFDTNGCKIIESNVFDKD